MIRLTGEPTPDDLHHGEPPQGSLVRDANGRVWQHTGDWNSTVNWERTDVDYFEPESWFHVCQFGPVTILKWGYEE